MERTRAKQWMALILVASSGGCISFDGLGRPSDGSSQDIGCAGCDAGTGSSEVTAMDVTGMMMTRFVINKLTLPMANKDYAIDLNGDGRLDNQFGNIIGTLAANNLDAQSSVDQSIETGESLHLFGVRSSDSTLRQNELAAIDFYLAKSFAGILTNPDGGCIGCPDFGGNGVFTIDGAAAAPGHLFGLLSAGIFRSNNPVKTINPTSITLKIAMIAYSAPIALKLNGAHIQFDVVSGQGVKPALMHGQINGSIKNADVQITIIPAIAQLLTMRLKADPTSPSSKQIAGIFDTGGCGNAKANDGIIDTCEVANNSIIMAVLAPDVQIYDAGGNYAPSAANKMKDSVSIGVAFDAVAASF